MTRDVAPYIVAVQVAEDTWRDQDLVRGWSAAMNTATRALGLYPAVRIKDRYGKVVYEGPTPKAPA